MENLAIFIDAYYVINFVAMLDILVQYYQFFKLNL